MPSSLHCIVDAAVDPDRVVVRDGGGRVEGWKEGRRIGVASVPVMAL
jgi:hypothetical protein